MYAYDIYSGYLEDTLNVIGSRDTTLVERYQRLGLYAQRVLGLPETLMQGWQEAVESLIMRPPEELTTPAEAIAMLIFLRDASKRRFRILLERRDDSLFEDFFAFLKAPHYCADFLNSDLAKFHAPDPRIRWGFLDVQQVEALLLHIFGDDSFKENKTAVIAGRLSHMSRASAESALLDVGIETQNSISHNINYLILGSKGTGGTKHEKVLHLKDGGQRIQVLDEAGFDALLRSPKAAAPDWPSEKKENFEAFVSALRHVWACDLDLYCLSFEYDPTENTL